VGLAAHIHQAEPALGRALLEELGSFVHPTR
jgi:hypothetical protein